MWYGLRTIMNGICKRIGKQAPMKMGEIAIPFYGKQTMLCFDHETYKDRSCHLIQLYQLYRLTRDVH